LDSFGYQAVNVQGTHNLLDLARELKVPQFVFTSSASVYGGNANVPWREDDHELQPISPYAVTKVSGELLGRVYSHLYGTRFVGLRLSTVYGPRQRPDLAIHRFATRMLAGVPIPVFGDGSARRDYTFVDDIVSGIRAAMEYRRSAFEIVNLGHTQTMTVNQMIGILESTLGVRAVVDRQPPQAGDVPQTSVSIEKARDLFRYDPKVPLATGVARFVDWLVAETVNV
jgi:UDP-glucuronate 4-epimerase